MLTVQEDNEDDLPRTSRNDLQLTGSILQRRSFVTEAIKAKEPIENLNGEHRTLPAYLAVSMRRAVHVLMDCGLH
ncbi:hypothetical protein EYF80_051822 [Liparis tanakae]|uniref:Uncharacterized protein n=1 Tax=Liparis tanakae TaxID=230148 RepID=A0A4Z2FA37_9TELE|nr:hypothetical protein EYF80_051822 [Liparis tanakae]